MTKPEKNLVPFRPEKPKGFVVKRGLVSISVYPHWHRGKWVWRFDKPEKRQRQSKKAIKELAEKLATAENNATVDLMELPEPLLSVIKEMAKIPGLDFADVEKLRASKLREFVPIEDARDKFLSVKLANEGKSKHNLANLRRYLKSFVGAFAGRDLGTIATTEVEDWLTALVTRNGARVAPRTQNNHLRALSSFFRWSEGRLIPRGSNPCASIERRNEPMKAPATWTPEEMGAMLAAVSPRYGAWLAITAFAGVRREELWRRQERGGKPRLRWENIRWSEGIIEIPADTSKTGKRRIIPILPALEAWVKHFHPTAESLKGDICHPPPMDQSTSTDTSETFKLGEVVGGGWRKNAQRDSFVSYRAAIVGPGQAALEAGHSESESTKSYRDAKSKADAEAYFNLRPSQ